MSRSHTPQPEQHGVTHTGQSPQVAVRDGNRLLCPCCGQTLMVLKEKRFRPPKKHHMQGDPRRTWPSLERLIAEQEAHYQNGSADEPPSQEPPRKDDDQDRPMYRADSLIVPIDPQVASHEFPPLDPPPFDPLKISKPVKRSPQEGVAYKPPRDWNTQYEEHQRRRSKRPLEEATTYEMARLYAWAYYRLQRLAVQIEKEIAAKEAEVETLQTELSGGHVEPSKTASTDRTEPTIDARAQANLSVVPSEGNTHGRTMTMTTRRHAHADEGMAPRSMNEASTNHASLANERGPP